MLLCFEALETFKTSQVLTSIAYSNFKTLEKDPPIATSKKKRNFKLQTTGDPHQAGVGRRVNVTDSSHQVRPGHAKRATKSLKKRNIFQLSDDIRNMASHERVLENSIRKCLGNTIRGRLSTQFFEVRAAFVCLLD